MEMLVFLAGVGVTAMMLALVLGAWIAVAGDREDEHWPAGLDEEPALQVQNRVGDSRRVR